MTQDTEIKIEFDQNRKDIIAFGYIYQKSSQANSFFSGNLPLVVAGVMAACLAYQYLWLSEPVNYSILFAFACYVLYALSYKSSVLYGMLFWPRLKRGRTAIRGKVLITLNSGQLQFRADGYEQDFGWQSFHTFVRGKEHLFLFTRTGEGLLFPKRAFLLAQEAYDFEHYIRQNLENHNKKP